jgi:hypothetical protein
MADHPKDAYADYIQRRRRGGAPTTSADSAPSTAAISIDAQVIINTERYGRIRGNVTRVITNEDGADFADVSANGETYTVRVMELELIAPRPAEIPARRFRWSRVIAVYAFVSAVMMIGFLALMSIDASQSFADAVSDDPLGLLALPVVGMFYGAIPTAVVLIVIAWRRGGDWFWAPRSHEGSRLSQRREASD